MLCQGSKWADLQPDGVTGLPRASRKRPGRELASLFDVPAEATQKSMSCRCQAGEVRHLRARDKGKAGFGRKADELLKPAAGDLFHDSSRRTAGIESRILVP